jgi:hypothetical protein
MIANWPVESISHTLMAYQTLNENKSPDKP